MEDAIRIFIDQGHNNSRVNTGAEGNGLIEAEINFNVGSRLAELLRADPQFEVRTSRQSPDDVLGTDSASSLATRVEMANTWPADYFISIHTNANNNPAVQGTEMYIYSLNSPAYLLAEDMLQGVVDAVGTKNNRVRVNTSFYVLRRTQMPAVLAELAYLTNEEDAALLACCQEQFAQGLYQGIRNYFSLPPA